MITLAKALGNGFPIGALLAKEKDRRGLRSGEPRIDLRRQSPGLLGGPGHTGNHP